MHFVSIPPEAHFFIQGFYFIIFCFPVYFLNMIVFCLIWVGGGEGVFVLWFGVFFLSGIYFTVVCAKFFIQFGKMHVFYSDIMPQLFKCQNKWNVYILYKAIYKKQKHVAFILLSFMCLIFYIAISQNCTYFILVNYTGCTIQIM